jgi:hypothetical protein
MKTNLRSAEGLEVLKKEILNSEIVLHYKDEKFSGKIVDLSDYGIEIQSENKIPCFVEMEVLIKLPRCENDMKHIGIVLTSEEIVDKNGYKTAIYFQDEE